MSLTVAGLHLGSVTQTNRRERAAATTLSATPRFPEEDSTMVECSSIRPSRSADATMEVAALSFTEPAKLKPSHLRCNGMRSVCPRST